MDLLFLRDPSGRLVCELVDEQSSATVTAANMPGATDGLRAALDDARTGGLGECLWLEPAGEYRWMLRREGDRLTVAVMWCAGTVIGWQHVFRSECGFGWFAGRVADELQRLGLASPASQRGVQRKSPGPDGPGLSTE
jgi:hypothetical protein